MTRHLKALVAIEHCQVLAAAAGSKVDFKKLSFRQSVLRLNGKLEATDN